MTALEFRGIGMLSGIGMAGVYEPPSAGNFSAVQIKNNTAGVARGFAVIVDPFVFVDLDCTVRIPLHATDLTDNDGLVSAVDAAQGTVGLVGIQARSASPAAAPSVGFGAFVRVPAGGVTLPGIYRIARGAGVVWVPTVTGIGIGVYAQFAGSVDGVT